MSCLIVMSQKELHRLERDLSARQMRRLLDRIRTSGAASVRHKAIGLPHAARRSITSTAVT